MSKTSKALLIVSAFLFFLSFFMHQFKPQPFMGELDGMREEWVTMVIDGPTAWHDAWNITIVITSWVAFASVVCAILLWRRDRPHKYQKLFPE